MQKGIGYSISVSVCVGIINLTGPTALMAGNTPPSAPVTVVNTTANPVPVVQQGPISISGGVSISGTPNVSVANTTANPVPVVQQGTPNVTVANTTAAPVPVVQQGAVSLATGTSVKVSADTPLPVAPHQPQLVRLSAHTASGNSMVIWTVPHGKLLLINYANWFAGSSDTTQLPMGLITTSNPDFSNPHFYYFPATAQGVNGDHLFSSSFQVKIVAEAGQQISVGIEAGQAEVEYIVLTGTLIDDDGSFISVDVSQ